jgi:hypothetical protein
MVHLLLVLGWVGSSACVALGVAVMSDRLLDTFSPSRPLPVRVRVSPGDQRQQLPEKETIHA